MAKKEAKHAEPVNAAELVQIEKLQGLVADLEERLQKKHDDYRRVSEDSRLAWRVVEGFLYFTETQSR